MRTFTLIWFGQLVSNLGTYMTFFALTLWLWDQTESVTTLALMGIFSRLPAIAATVFAGLIVDRFNRKYLMLMGDAVAALATASVGILYLTQQLQIWHLYLILIIAGGFGQIQTLAYQASISLMVPPQHYTRTGSMTAIVRYGSNIVGPSLAAILYPLIEVSGVIAVDLITFAVAFATLLSASIPQPERKLKPEKQIKTQSWISQFIFGFHHIWKQSSLKALLLVMVLFTFAHDLAGAVSSPMILARTNGSAQALASVSAMAGISGVTGAVIVGVWGGPKRRIHGVLGGYIGAGLSKTIFGLGQSLTIWMPAQMCSSLNFPLISSTRTALWMDKISPEIQGRVFAARDLVIQIVSTGAILIAGPLADQLFEPAMMSDKPLSNLLGISFGIGPGAGMAVIYTFCSLVMILAGLGGFFIPSLKVIDLDTRRH
ncbi:MAG: MFS transporter [Cyanobacteria bacterium P01_H01_bin.21]